MTRHPFEYRIYLRNLFQRIHSDSGTVAVSFILCLPIFLIILAIFLQYALLINAKMVVDHAAESAGRAAVVCLPTEQAIDDVDATQKINQAACMALTALSPKATDAPTAEAQAVANAFAQVSAPMPSSYAARYTYAQAATTVTWPQANYATQHAQSVEVTVQYQFQLTVPVARTFIGQAINIAGVNGHVFNLVSTAQVELAHGRQAGGP